jgi:META domain
MKSIRVLFYFISLTFLFGCAKVEVVSPLKNYVQTTTSPFGVWKFVSYSDGKTIPYQVVIELTNETNKKGKLLLNGKGAVNFYFSTYEFDSTTKAIKIDKINSTIISTASAERSFEDTYFSLLSQAIRYSISTEGTQLTLYLPDASKTVLAFEKK